MHESSVSLVRLRANLGIRYGSRSGMWAIPPGFGLENYARPTEPERTTFLMGATTFAFTPICNVCGQRATHIELRSAGEEWRFLYDGIDSGNGTGSVISAARAVLITSAFIRSS